MNFLPKTNLKIAFVHNAYIEYRTPLFEKLSAKYNMTFFFEWFDISFAKSKPKFYFRFLKSYPIKDEYSFSPMLFYFLIKGKYNLFIAGAIGQVNTYITYFVSRLLRKPFIFWDENWYLPRTKWRVLGWPLIKSTLRNAKAIVVPGRKSKDYYLSIPQIKRDRIFVAPNASVLPPVNEAIYREIDDIRETLKLKGKKIILYVGRLTKIKGFNYLLAAFLKIHAIYPETALVVVGGKYGKTQKYGSVDFSFDIRVLEKNSVYFVGWKCNPEKAAYFLLADIVVVPSVFDGDRCEVWGFAVNEAMFAGKPVIATKAVGAAYDLIRDGINGYIVPDKDPVALFEAIKSIIDNPSIQKRMSAQSLGIFYSGFTYENMVLGFINAIAYAVSD